MCTHSDTKRDIDLTLDFLSVSTMEVKPAMISLTVPKLQQLFFFSLGSLSFWHQEKVFSYEQSLRLFKINSCGL